MVARRLWGDLEVEFGIPANVNVNKSFGPAVFNEG